jgi:hypothetical protein
LRKTFVLERIQNESYFIRKNSDFYSKKFGFEFGIPIVKKQAFENIRHFEYAFQNSNFDYSNEFVYIRPSLENSIVFVVFQAKSRFLPPLENVCLPLDAHVVRIFLAFRYFRLCTTDGTGSRDDIC